MPEIVLIGAAAAVAIAVLAWRYYSSPVMRPDDPRVIAFLRRIAASGGAVSEADPILQEHPAELHAARRHGLIDMAGGWGQTEELTAKARRLIA